ncbi:MAG: alpha/beta hydrolase-fold protein, partial [Bacteroidota bacterium]
MNPDTRFRTIRISDPRFESDHLRCITVKSAHLRGRGDICVFVPPDTNATDLPIVLLLHGVYGGAWSWSQGGGAHRTALRLITEGKLPPMLLAMPSDGLWGDGSGYTPHATQDFEKWIVEDVIDAVKLTIPQAANSTTTFLAGLSMGGYGTLHLGGKYPQLFKAISAHSAITAFEQMALFVEEPIDSFRPADPLDAEALLILRKHKDQLPPLRFD